VKAYISQPCLTAPLKPHRHLLGSCPHCEIATLRAQLAASEARAERLAGALRDISPHLNWLICCAGVDGGHVLNNAVAGVRAALAEGEAV